MELLGPNYWGQAPPNYWGQAPIIDLLFRFDPNCFTRKIYIQTKKEQDAVSQYQFIIHFSAETAKATTVDIYPSYKSCNNQD